MNSLFQTKKYFITKHRHFIILLFVLILMFCTTSALASANPQLTSLKITVAGVDKTVQLNALVTEYSVDIQTNTAIPVTIKATANTGCSIYLDSGRTQPPLPYTLTVSPDTTTSLLLVVADTNGQKTSYRLNLVAVLESSPTVIDDGTAETDSGSAFNVSPSPNSTIAENTDDAAISTPASAENLPSEVVSLPSEIASLPSEVASLPSEVVPTAASSSQTLEPKMTHLIMYINAPFYFLNRVYRDMDVAPYAVTDASGGGYTMVPVRFVAESLGADVDWKAATNKVSIDLDGRHFELTIGQLVPGTPVAAIAAHNRTFVPLRYVMESFGALVFWTQNEQRIDIYYAPKSTV